MTIIKQIKTRIKSSNGKWVDVSNRYIEGVKKQMIKHIKKKRNENIAIVPFYFYGIAELIHTDESVEPFLSITYGDALSALEVDKRGKIYVEVPYRNQELNRVRKKKIVKYK